MFEKISTNQGPRVRSWPCRLHESEIRGQGNQRFFSLSSSLSQLLVAASRLALDLFRKEKSRKTSGTRVIIVSLSIQRIVRSVIQPLGCNGFLIKLSIYLSIYLKRAKCRDFLAKSRSVLYFRQVSFMSCWTRNISIQLVFAEKQQKMHIFVDRFTVPLSVSVRNGVMFCNSWNCLETCEQQFG